MTYPRFPRIVDHVMGKIPPGGDSTELIDSQKRAAELVKKNEAASYTVKTKRDQTVTLRWDAERSDYEALLNGAPYGERIAGSAIIRPDGEFLFKTVSGGKFRLAPVTDVVVELEVKNETVLDADELAAGDRYHNVALPEMCERPGDRALLVSTTGDMALITLVAGGSDPEYLVQVADRDPTPCRGIEIDDGLWLDVPGYARHEIPGFKDVATMMQVADSVSLRSRHFDQGFTPVVGAATAARARGAVHSGYPPRGYGGHALLPPDKHFVKPHVQQVLAPARNGDALIFTRHPGAPAWVYVESAINPTAKTQAHADSVVTETHIDGSMSLHYEARDTAGASLGVINVDLVRPPSELTTIDHGSFASRPGPSPYFP